MKNLADISAAQLRRAADIKDQITTLEGALNDVLSGYIPVQRAPVPEHKLLPLPKRRRMSAAARAKISTAMKKRWRKAWAKGNTTL